MNAIEKNIKRAMECLESACKVDYIGESISQLEHALQSAYFAEQSGHSDEVMLAGLFHDIGHFASQTQQFSMDNLGVVNHEWIGASILFEMGFSKKVALLVGYHVDAKRYLAGKKPSYYERLSSASKQTLIFQGGPMLASEMQQFESHLYFKEIIQVRINDEKAKEINLVVPQLDYYLPAIKKHLEKNNSIKISEHPLSDFVNDQWVSDIKNFLHRCATKAPLC